MSYLWYFLFGYVIIEVETIGGQKPITLLKSRCNVSTANLMGDNSPSETNHTKITFTQNEKIYTCRHPHRMDNKK